MNDEKGPVWRSHGPTDDKADRERSSRKDFNAAAKDAPPAKDGAPSDRTGTKGDPPPQPVLEPKWAPKRRGPGGPGSGPSAGGWNAPSGGATPPSGPAKLAPTFDNAAKKKK